MTAPPVFTLVEGVSPLLLSIPHAGTYLPPDIEGALTAAARDLPDTDWHVDRLYAFAAAQDATVLTATHSRYAVDLNRSPTGGALYPGLAETGLCPTETFDGLALYNGPAPDAAEIGSRITLYWQPYHDALRTQIARLRDRHGFVHVLDGHSIRGEIPRLFAGALPDLNLGSFDGASAAAALTARVMQAVENQGFSCVLNGRFKGGFITRHYGAPDDRVHVLQLEMAWRAYLDESHPAIFDPARAAPLMAVLRRVVGVMTRA